MPSEKSLNEKLKKNDMHFISRPRVLDILNGKYPAGQSIEINGWVKTRRDSKGGFSFFQINDGSCLANLQIIAESSLENYESELITLSSGSAISIKGTIKASEGKQQSLEILASNIRAVGKVEDPESYPIAKKRHSFEYLRSEAHLRPRTNTFGAVSRLRHVCAQAIHEFFNQHHFFWVNTPIITASDCEGAGELFRISTLDFHNIPKDNNQKVDFSQDFFGKPTYLTVSGQLNVETHCMALSRVYTFGPTFRAENSNTSRHLAEFWMVEPELAFADLKDVSQLAESFLKFVFKEVMEKSEDDLAFFNQHVNKEVLTRTNTIIEKPFEYMSYTQAIEILSKAKTKFEFPVKWGLDLQSEHERYLCENHIKGPMLVYDYPKEIKAFYMRENDDGKTCAAMDILVPGIGEIIGGSQREERLDQLDKKLKVMQLEDDLSWYRDLRRYGTVPHGGFGLGFERLLNYISGLDNIRDVIPFPRTPGNASF